VNPNLDHLEERAAVAMSQNAAHMPVSPADVLALVAAARRLAAQEART
jgi:hypothetical protein